MIKIAIIDDEADARFLIRKCIQEQLSDAVSLVEEASSMIDGIRLLESKKFDLVLLDIQLGDGTGFGLLEQLKKKDFGLVFITAYDRFALRAFEFFALAYLVKPFKTSDLIKAISRFLQQVGHANTQSVSMLQASLKNRPLNKIVIPDQGGFQVIGLEQILYLESHNNYTEFNLINGQKILSSQTLKAYEKLLDDQFFRCHQRYVINLQQVKSYDRSEGGEVTLSSGKRLPVGRRRQAAFRDRFL